MGLLDKLKPQPRWKNADPVVRLEAIRDLEDPSELATLAETDPDARIRRATVAKLDDPMVLGRMAASDPDTDVRDRVGDRLASLASGSDEALAIAAVGQLTDGRRLSTIAKGSGPVAVCLAALGRTTDERALGAIARHAAHEAVAAQALQRVSSRDELVEIAAAGDHRDVALAAFERAVAPNRDLAELRGLESRAGQKAVSKRARGIIQEIEDAEAARRAAEEERRRREAALCADVERLADVADIATAKAELARLSEAWSGLDASADGLARFESGVAAANDAVARREREAEEAAERARARAEALASREALSVRVETLDGDHMLEQLASIEEEWRSLTPLVGNGPEADRLAERFAVAVAGCRKRHELSAVAAETLVKLEALVAEAETLPAQEDAAAAGAHWQALKRDARGLAGTLAEAGKPAPELTARLDAVDEVFAAREAAKRDAAAKAQQDLVSRLQRLIERAKRASEADTITLREGDRLMRDIGTALEDCQRAAAAHEIDEALGRLRHLQEAVAPRVRELREMDDWRRFANAQQQEQLIAMAEAIVSSLKSEEEAGKPSDLAATARALKQLHAKWQEVAEAPRQSAQRLWDRFRLATDFIRSRCETYFAKLREEQSGNLDHKRALVEEAEALAQSTDWARTTSRFQELQTAWQSVGPVPRHDARDLAQRFRTACALYFARRREDLTARKKVWSDNLEKKEALCQRAETLVESTDWDAASREMKRLQSDWKTIGPVRRTKSEAVWNRFRAAADKFFERYHNRHQITIAGKLAEREALVVELESLAAADPDSAPADLVARVEALRSTWNRSVPIPAAEMQPIADRWRGAFASILEKHGHAFSGTDLDPTAIRQRMERLLAKVEGYAKETRDPLEGLSQTELLAARLRSALASNAMGGRATEESKWRSAIDAVRDAQGAWDRLLPLATGDARALDGRFRDACRRVLDQARRHGASPAHTARRQPKTTAAAAV